MHVLYDNFIFNENIDITTRSEAAHGPAINLRNPNPDKFYQSVGIHADGEFIKIHNADTGDAKPFVYALYKTNLTKDAEIILENNSIDSFGSPASSDTYAVEEDFYDFNSPKKGLNKLLIGNINTLATTNINKTWQRLVIKDATNPDGFIRLGVVALGSLINLNSPNDGEEAFVINQKFNDNTEYIKSINGQLHTRIKKVNHVMSINFSNVGLYTKLAVRRLIRRVGINTPVFITFNATTQDSESEYSTQSYYGYFSKLPALKENHYDDMWDRFPEYQATEWYEDYALIDYSLEFTEIP